jgi:hypothetical protein
MEVGPVSTCTILGIELRIYMLQYHLLPLGHFSDFFSPDIQVATKDAGYASWTSKGVDKHLVQRPSGIQFQYRPVFVWKLDALYSLQRLKKNVCAHEGLLWSI